MSNEIIKGILQSQVAEVTKRFKFDATPPDKLSAVTQIAIDSVTPSLEPGIRNYLSERNIELLTLSDLIIMGKWKGNVNTRMLLSQIEEFRIKLGLSGSPFSETIVALRDNFNFLNYNAPKKIYFESINILNLGQTKKSLDASRVDLRSNRLSVPEAKKIKNPQALRKQFEAIYRNTR